MYAIIQDRGHQYRAGVGDTLILDRIEAEVGSSLEMPLLLLAGDAVEVGSPVVAGKVATLQVLRHQRGRKGIAGTFKRRKDSRRRVGFRHEQTVVRVESLG